ncbi:pentatricopeptide repeat-containing protein 1, mitochondrial-like [Diachasma alloeum]|uniref:pentatricopeptide repeat-containing protein 1, mitochondrial-like n=1 Tax=Diachasma alloeum TaxID=454923 RepID=UPI0007383EAE|nr:pentatricopeptide repeat-containing protein 1, mitochondrial-like [Diachasma alloeum]
MLSILSNPLRTSLKYLSVVRSLQNSHQLGKNASLTSTVSDFFLFRLQNQKQLSRSHNRFYTVEKFVSRDPDIFGDIGGNKFEEFPLDPDEREQEQFEKTEATVPRRLKLSKGQYADLIKERIRKGDLESAVKVLNLVKDNRDQPTTYMYTLLLRAFAVQGDLNTTWKLFTSMKKRALMLNAATYVSVINACANSSEREIALDRLERIREEIILKNIVLNEVHYNALVKAYGRHKCLLEAFKIVDQMIDKKMTIGKATFNSLLYGCISDRENGLRHALVVWHMMQRWRKKPDLLTYNLMLRAIRDTKMGNLKTNDILLHNYEASRIVINDSFSPDLLSHPPVVSNIRLPVRNSGRSQMTCVAATKTLAIVKDKGECENFKLEEIHEKNKFILFGGFNGFMQRLEADGIHPDAKTMTLLLDVVPNSVAIERKLINTARTNKIPLDIDFFNMLIKKRSFRKDYKQAKRILIESELKCPKLTKASYVSVAQKQMFPTDYQALVFEALEKVSATKYAIAIAAHVERKQIQYVYKMSKQRFFCYLSSKELADKYLNEFKTVKINNKTLQASPLVARHQRIIISNVRPSISHEVIEKPLKEKKIEITSPVKFMKAGLDAGEGFDHASLDASKHVVADSETGNSEDDISETNEESMKTRPPRSKKQRKISDEPAEMLTQFAPVEEEMSALYFPQLVNLVERSKEIVKPEVRADDAASQQRATEWERNDRKARSDIILNISPSEVKLVKGCTTSKMMWDKLNWDN